MISCWPKLLVLFRIRMFSLSLIFLGYTLVLWSQGLWTDWVLIVLSRPCIAIFFNSNDNNNNINILVAIMLHHKEYSGFRILLSLSTGITTSQLYVEETPTHSSSGCHLNLSPQTSQMERVITWLGMSGLTRRQSSRTSSNKKHETGGRMNSPSCMRSF